jgi:MFS family permease
MHIFFIISFLTEFAGNLFYFTLPLLALRAGASAVQLGILGSVGTLFYVPFAVFFGHVSGKLTGHRLPFYALCLIIATETVVFCVHTVPVLFAAVLVMGMAFAGFWPPLMNQLNRETGGSGKTVGFFSFSWSIGTILGPVVAGYLFERAELLPIILSILVFALIGALLGPWSRRAAGAPPAAAEEQTPAHLTSRPLLIFAYCGLFASYFAFGAVRNLFPQLAVNIIRITPFRLGMLFSLMDAFRTLTFFMFGRKEALYRSPMRFVGAGIIAYFSLAGLIFSDAQPLFALDFALLGGIMTGIYYSYGLYAAFNLRRGRALAVGVFEAVIGIGAGAGSFFGGLSTTCWGPRGPYLLALIVGIGVSLGQWVLFARERRTS